MYKNIFTTFVPNLVIKISHTTIYARKKNVLIAFFIFFYINIKDNKKYISLNCVLKV